MARNAPEVDRRKISCNVMASPSRPCTSAIDVTTLAEAARSLGAGWATVIVRVVVPNLTTALLSAAKAWAWLNGSPGVTPDHVQAMVLPVLRHRIQLRPEAELEGVSVDAILRSILTQVQVPI